MDKESLERNVHMLRCNCGGAVAAGFIRRSCSRIIGARFPSVGYHGLSFVEHKGWFAGLSLSQFKADGYSGRALLFDIRLAPSILERNDGACVLGSNCL